MVVKWEIYRNYKSTLREQLHLSLREKKTTKQQKKSNKQKNPKPKQNRWRGGEKHQLRVGKGGKPHFFNKKSERLLIFIVSSRC